MGKVTMRLALVTVVLVGLALAGREADVARVASGGGGGSINYSALARGNSPNTTADSVTAFFARARADGADVRPAARANAYTRGCSKINRCRD